MTDIDLIKQALEYLEDNQHHIADHERHAYVMLYNDFITALKARLADYAMRETQRLGQEIEQEPICPKCKAEVLYECVACSSNNYPPPQRTEQEPDDIASIIACRNILDAQPVPPRRTEPLIGCVNHDCAKCKERNT
jgi:hypothetical protein